MVLLRVLTQLESVYSVMKLENYTKIIDDLQFDRYEAERLVVEASASNQLHIRFDYLNRCVYFNHGVADKDIITHYMSSLSAAYVFTHDFSLTIIIIVIIIVINHHHAFHILVFTRPWLWSTPSTSSLRMRPTICTS